MNKEESNKNLGFLIHIMIWTGLMLMPYLVGVFTQKLPPFNFGMIVMPMQLMGLFYLNYHFLINRLLFGRKIWTFVTLNLLIVALLTVVGLIIITNNPNFPAARLQPPSIKLHIVMDVATQILVVGLSVAIRMTGKWYEARQQVQALEKANTEAELQQLKSQLNPHFLFNSLNNIYALIAFDPDKAQLSLHNLCDMLRYQLYESNRETIPLDKEVEFVRSYCELMRLRLPREINVSVDLPEPGTGILIAPLLFISIVENAFKHGVSLSHPSHIDIRLSLEGENVECLVRNSYFPKTNHDRSGSGIGLENLRRRLTLLYPHAHTFMAEGTGDEFVAHLLIRKENL